jgi:hypothetical protein
MSDGFLGRWSQRKLEVKQGKAVEAEPLAGAVDEIAPPPEISLDKKTDEQGAALAEATEPVVPSPAVAQDADAASPEPPLPTLEDVKALTADSDFSRFVAPNVGPEVKNAALKKLFTDPRYNVMDGLDIYTGDYSQPDPMPESMLRQLASAKFLHLFDLEEQQEAEAAEAARRARDDADNPTVQTVAQSEAAPPAPPAVPEPADHADPDLRLQQDHAAPGEDPGHGAQ